MNLSLATTYATVYAHVRRVALANLDRTCSATELADFVADELASLGSHHSADDMTDDLIASGFLQ